MDSTTITVNGPALALLDELEAAASYAERSHAPATRTAYGSAWRGFAAWCNARDIDALPAAPQTLAAWLAARADAGIKPASISLGLTAIRQAHAAAGLEHAVGHPAVVAVWKGIRRTVGTAQRQVAAVCTDELRAMVAALPAGLGGARDRALLLLGWSGAMRRSELVALDVADVAHDAKGAIVTIRRSKTDGEGRGAEARIAYGSSAEVCPVRALRAWLEAAGIAEGAIFRAVDRHGRVGERLEGAAVAAVVKRAAERAGMDPDRVAGHSLRAGLATSAARAGRSDRSIMAQGRWASRAMVDRYVRAGNGWDGNASIGLL